MTTDTITINAPGVYDLPAEVYHRDPVAGGSLSSTGARRLLPPSCPARYRHWVDTEERETKAAWDLGHAAHKLVLGVGPELVRVEGTGVDPEAWRTNEDKAAVAVARERGAVPLKPSQWNRVHAMADALRAHPFASKLFQPGHDQAKPGNHGGKAEQTLVWRDRQTGIWLRAMLDWLPYWSTDNHRRPSRLIIPDYKSCRSAAPDEIERAVHNFGYHQQDAWYRDGIRALFPGLDEPAFVFVFQETEPPYLVTVVNLAAEAVQIGQRLNRQAIEKYAQCVQSGQWPGYADDVATVSLPPWAINRYADVEESW